MGCPVKDPLRAVCVVEIKSPVALLRTGLFSFRRHAGSELPAYRTRPFFVKIRHPNSS